MIILITASSQCATPGGLGLLTQASASLLLFSPALPPSINLPGFAIYSRSDPRLAVTASPSPPASPSSKTDSGKTARSPCPSTLRSRARPFSRRWTTGSARGSPASLTLMFGERVVRVVGRCGMMVGQGRELLRAMPDSFFGGASVAVVVDGAGAGCVCCVHSFIPFRRHTLFFFLVLTTDQHCSFYGAFSRRNWWNRCW
ncbi:hypothetical protein K438DRAFT_598880 [Mycena galopus ATCC 62051]|nr:hypothetical protein K438DRAFT_598880 [Mycena galopus ATCC 62051]